MASGLATGAMVSAIRENGVDHEETLANNDAYAILKAGGALLVTGPPPQRQRPSDGARVQGLEKVSETRTRCVWVTGMSPSSMGPKNVREWSPAHKKRIESYLRVGKAR